MKITPQNSEHGMMAELMSRPYWCISRQRSWGVPIPIFYHKRSGDPLITRCVLLSVSVIHSVIQLLNFSWIWASSIMFSSVVVGKGQYYLPFFQGREASITFVFRGGEPALLNLSKWETSITELIQEFFFSMLHVTEVFKDGRPILLYLQESEVNIVKVSKSERPVLIAGNIHQIFCLFLFRL